MLLYPPTEWLVQVFIKTYINITLNSIILPGFAAQFFSLVYKVYSHHIFKTKCHKQPKKTLKIVKFSVTFKH